MRGYVIWSSMSWGLRPGHSVNTICWFSPMSGMASTGTGSRAIPGMCQSNGATVTPKYIAPRSTIATTSFCSRQNRMIALIGVRGGWLLMAGGLLAGAGGGAGRELLQDLAALEHRGAEVGVVDFLAPLEPVGALEVEGHGAESVAP